MPGNRAWLGKYWKILRRETFEPESYPWEVTGFNVIFGKTKPSRRWFWFAPLVIAATALLLAILWKGPLSEKDLFPEYTSTAPMLAELASLPEEEYLVRRKHRVLWTFDDPPIPDEGLAQQWKGAPQPKAVVMVPPPLFDAAMRHHHPVVAGHL